MASLYEQIVVALRADSNVTSKLAGGVKGVLPYAAPTAGGEYLEANEQAAVPFLIVKVDPYVAAARRQFFTVTLYGEDQPGQPGLDALAKAVEGCLIQQDRLQPDDRGRGFGRAKLADEPQDTDPGWQRARRTMHFSCVGTRSVT